MLIRTAAALGAAFLAAASSAADVQGFDVPYGSFEGPATEFVDLRIDGWQKFPLPPGFPVTPEQWEQSVGIFANTAPGAADHIDNIDGKQALFVFSAPGAGVFQDAAAVDWSGRTGMTTTRFEPGRSYAITVGLIGGGGNMPEGATILVNAYYRDAGNTMVTVASLPVTHSRAQFPTTTHFVDVTLNVPMIKGADAAAGKPMGISLVSVGPPELPGGYWDVDHVRVSSTVPLLNNTNPSFELPDVPFVGLDIDGWTKNPKPPGFPVSDEQWAQSVGLFQNTAPGAADHIPNIDGEQAVFIFNAPGAGISQALSHTYEAGSSYNLSAGLIGGGGGMPPGVQLMVGLFYLGTDNSVNLVSSTTVGHSTEIFPSTNEFIDVQTATMPILATDAMAGRPIVVSVVSLGPPEIQGGYWDVDNIRVTMGIPSVRVSAKYSDGGISMRWPSASGYRYQLRTSADGVAWTNLDEARAGNGLPLTRTIAATGGPAFYAVLVTRAP